MSATKPAALDLAQFEGHTEGPWLIYDGGTGFAISVGRLVTGPNGGIAGYPVCSMAMAHRETATGNANARLIAAAPTLLAEVKRLREANADLIAALRQVSDLLPFAHGAADLRALQSIANAAIAKAGA